MTTQAEIATHLDLTSRQVRNLIADGTLPTGERRGDLDPDECRIAYIRYLRALVTKQGVRRTNAGDEKTRLARAHAEKTEFENEVRRGLFIPVDLHGELLRKVAGEVAGQMSGFPGRVSARVASIRNPGAVRELLVEECNGVRNGVAKILGEIAHAFEEHAATQPEIDSSQSTRDS